MSEQHQQDSNAALPVQQWIVQQAAAGRSPQEMIQSLVDAGWQQDVAIEAMQSALPLGGATPAVHQDLPVAVAVPDARLVDAPLFLDAGDRQVAVLGAMTCPRVIMLGGLLSDEECDALIEAAKPRLARSLTVAVKTGGEELNINRTSQGMFFERGENELVRRIEQRIARLVNWPLENGEGLQILNYAPGAQYKPHYDYFDPAQPASASILQRGGQRVATLVMYLNNPEKGGGTTFPDARLTVGPLRGNAVFFSYAMAHPASKTLHGGEPVVAGEKWIATKWLREREFK